MTKKCVCIREYIFHKTDDFPGVIFQKNMIYIVKPCRDSDELLGVINKINSNDVIVGMSIETFNKHFVFQ